MESRPTLYQIFNGLNLFEPTFREIGDLGTHTLFNEYALLLLGGWEIPNFTTNRAFVEKLETMWKVYYRNILRLWETDNREGNPLEDLHLRERRGKYDAHGKEWVTVDPTGTEGDVVKTTNRIDQRTVSINGGGFDGTAGANVPTTHHSKTPMNSGTFKEWDKETQDGQTGSYTKSYGADGSPGTNENETTTTRKQGTRTERDREDLPLQITGDVMGLNTAEAYTGEILERDGTTGNKTQEELAGEVYDLEGSRNYYTTVINMILRPLLVAPLY